MPVRHAMHHAMLTCACPAAFLFSAMYWKDSHRRDTYVNVLAVEGALYAVTLFLGELAQPTNSLAGTEL